VKIAILTAGTRGDTQPYIALGVALQQMGHAVRLATHENFAGFVQSFGLEFYPVTGDVSQVAGSESMSLARGSDNPLKLALSFRQLKAYGLAMQPDFYHACQDVDVIVYHPGPAIGYFAGQQLGIPSILATPFPMTPTAEYPALMFYNGPRLGRAANRLTHRIFERILWTTSAATIKQFWKKEFGRAPENFGNPFPRQTTPAMPTLVACSQAVFPRPADWPQGVYNTGYWFLDEEPGWQPPVELLHFLQGGRPPVYVGFGSIGDPAAAEQTTRLVIEALQLAGQRGVLATGWSGMTKLDSLPQEIFVLESAPHAWLFPRMAAVVHHGGAGTTAAGLRAGVPSVVIPSGLDQFAWARRLLELGAAPPAVPRKSLTAEGLAAAIRSSLRPGIVAQARLLGEQIRSENGAQQAAQMIVDLGFVD